MGLRFRKSLRIAPGVRLNITQSGVSTTLGPRGASVNLGTSGARGNVGIPGTGLSYSQRLSAGDGGHRGGAAANQAGQSGCALLGVIGLIILLVSMCSKDDSSPTAGSSSLLNGNSSEPVVAETRYVSARALNCRAQPSASGAVLAGLRQNDPAEVVDQSGTWSKLRRASGDCWVASSYLAAAPVLATQGLMSPKGNSNPGIRASSSGSSGRSKSGSSSNSSSKRSNSRTYFDRSCPCSGANVCIGPRGGRYCITSGGNKRYGV